MFKNNLKNKKGFSLVELMVVVAIMGTLAAIAIPAYNEYRKSAKKSAYKADLTSLHKGWLAFGVELDSFCERRTQPDDASIKNVGMESLFSSKLYGSRPGNNNFVGFGALHADCNNLMYEMSIVNGGTPTAQAYGDATSSGSASCVLDITTYRMGVAGHVSGELFIGYDISQSGVIRETAEGAYDATGVINTTTNTGICT